MEESCLLACASWLAQFASSYTPGPCAGLGTLPTVVWAISHQVNHEKERLLGWPTSQADGAMFSIEGPFQDAFSQDRGKLQTVEGLDFFLKGPGELAVEAAADYWALGAWPFGTCGVQILSQIK